MPYKITSDDDSITVTHTDHDAIIRTLELTERQRDLLEFVLADRFKSLRKQKTPFNPLEMDGIRELLTMIDPNNAETYADK